MIVKRYQHEIFRYAYSLLKDHDAAEDATQETFIKLFINLKKIDIKKSLKSWLYAVTKHFCFDVLRKQKRIVELNPDIVSDTEPVIESIIRKEEASVVKKAFQLLPGVYKKTLHARFYQGLSYKEIASMFEVPINTIKTHIKRGKNLLSVYIRSYEKPNPFTSLAGN